MTPTQIISLTLCDNEIVPGQIGLFLSRFQIDQFTCLRSLTLLDIGPDYWEFIMTKLHDLKLLRSFLYITSNKTDSWIAKMSYKEVTQLDARLFDSYSSMLSQLNRLKLSHGDFLESVQFPDLIHLSIGRCTTSLMKHLCSAAPRLKSLTIDFRNNEPNAEFIFPFHQLNRLSLKIEGQTVWMKNMEQLLSNIPNLIHLELCANGEADIVDGARWQMLTSRLVTFNFHFCISNNLDSKDLDSFRSSFWLDQKHWYVACIHRSLFSVPYFAEKCANEDFEPIVLSTLPDRTTFNDCISQLTLSELATDLNERFSQVQMLVMFNCIPLSSLEQLVDLNRINHFTLCSMTNYSGIQVLINSMPNLCRISIRSKVKYFLEEVQCVSFNKIQNLDVGNRYSINDDYENEYNIEKLSVVFPYIEHLHIDHWCSVTEILHIINKFYQLSTISFHFANWFVNEQDRNNTIIDVQSILDQNRCAKKSNFTYRFDRSCVHIWL
ncbi:unnamed protein product [Rotaria socialis]|nr:unnamed protein product [Rotaria socialis]